MTDPGAEEFQRGLALEVEGDTEGASREYERSMQIAGPKFLWQAGMRLGALRWNADDRAGALSSFRTAAAQPSEHQEVPGDAQGWIGYILAKQRHAYDSIVEYQKGAELDNAGCIYALGCVLEKDGDLRKALTYYTRADRLGSAEASNRMAVYYESLQNSAAAIAAWERGDERGDAEATMNVGYAYMRAGDFDQAIVAIMRAEERGHPRAPLLLGDLYVRRMAPAKFHEKAEPVQMALAAYGRALANNNVDVSPGAAVRVWQDLYVGCGPLRLSEAGSLKRAQPGIKPPRRLLREHLRQFPVSTGVLNHVVRARVPGGYAPSASELGTMSRSALKSWLRPGKLEMKLDI